mgnify:CR=1 FL=1
MMNRVLTQETIADIGSKFCFDNVLLNMILQVSYIGHIIREIKVDNRKRF